MLTIRAVQSRSCPFPAASPVRSILDTPRPLGGRPALLPRHLRCPCILACYSTVPFVVPDTSSRTLRIDRQTAQERLLLDLLEAVRKHDIESCAQTSLIPVRNLFRLQCAARSQKMVHSLNNEHRMACSPRSMECSVSAWGNFCPSALFLIFDSSHWGTLALFFDRHKHIGSVRKFRDAQV